MSTLSHPGIKPELTMPCSPSFPSIDPVKAQKCIDLFQRKKAVLDGIPGRPTKEIECIYYTTQAFTDLLTTLVSNPNNNGFRVYFASYCTTGTPGDSYIPKGRLENLTLIFVPTTSFVNHKPVADLTHCYILYKDVFVPIDATKLKGADDYLSTWVNHYQKTRKNLLQDEGITYSGAGFEESNSLWYDLDNFRPNGDRGVLDYIACRANAGQPITSICAWFAAFLPSALALDYKLTLIFDFLPAMHPLDGSPERFFTLSVNTKKHKNKHNHTLALDPDPVDTGNPCPPNSCDPDGDGLPQPGTP